MAPPNRPPGRAGVSNNYPWGPNPRDLYRAFIANAEFYGMPVTFLRAVGKGYTFQGTATAGPFADEAANVFLNTITLRSDTYDALADLDIEKPFGEATALQTVYHESTHAYLDLMENDPKFAAFIKEGVSYYTGAPLKGGGVSRTPDRLFQEAVASYVGNRVASWWLAFEVLTSLASAPRTDQGVRERLKRRALKSQTDYDKAMADRDFGYEEKSWHSSDQIETAKPISEHLRTFLDHELIRR